MATIKAVALGTGVAVGTISKVFNGHCFFACLVYYVEKELYKVGYKMFLCQSQRDSEKKAYYL